MWLRHSALSRSAIEGVIVAVVAVAGAPPLSPASAGGAGGGGGDDAPVSAGSPAPSPAAAAAEAEEAALLSVEHSSLGHLKGREPPPGAAVAEDAVPAEPPWS